MEKKMNNKGFSLVELIVVIAIMAVLVGVLAPQFIKYVEKSRESTDIQNVDSIRGAIEAYYSDKENVTGEVVIVVKSGAAPTISVGGTDDSTKAALKDGGVDAARLKSTQWGTSGIKMTYDPTTGKWSYTGTAKYYKASGDTFVAE